MSAPWDEMARLLFVLWSAPRAITTKSDFAREWANELAEASGRGLATTKIYPGLPQHGSYWRITAEGLIHLHSITEGLTPEAVTELFNIVSDQQGPLQE